MKRISSFLGAAVLATLIGCGGGGGSQFFGEVSGIVTDANGDPVRGARVTAAGRETFSNSAGSYVLTRVVEGDQIVRAEITQNGIDFSGQNVARIFGEDRTQTINIAVARTSLQAGIHGTVRDRFGNRIAGAKVFAMGNALTSSVAFTNSSGDYIMRGLMSGVNYQLTASARTFENDVDSVNLVPGEDPRFDFILGDGTNPAMLPPQNLSAVAWTTPSEITRSPSQRAGIEAVKNMLLPKRKVQTGRTTVNGNNVEVDLFWDEYTSNFDMLLGFGIYRSSTSGGQSTAIDFMRDPHAAFFQDLDDNLHENQNWYYEITALSTQYPDTFNSESNFSNRYGVATLGDLFLNSLLTGPLTFRWIAGSGATSYVVYLFDEFPGVGVNSVWNTEATPTSGTSQVYTGPALTSGHRYFYVVLGLANSGDSRTLSVIDEFIAN
jgi:hypothetical protein